MARDTENVRVLVRVRPLTTREERKGDEELVACVGDRSVQVVDPTQTRGRAMTGTSYQFNQCFGTECSQEKLFESCGVLPLLDHVLEGYSATVFAYGPTGSGKTYTITGRPDSILQYGSGDASDGVVIRSVEALFKKIREQQRDGLQFKVRTSCVEIYNENVLDLFRYSRGTAGKNYLPVKFDTNRASFFVGDLSYGKCNSEEDLLRLYMKALRNRSVASHELNRDSSRSHCLLTVYVDSMVAAENGQISTRHGKISFVDLAGSERLKDSQSQGSTLRETGSINKSIFTLGKVISSLCDRKKTKIPYRDSKLTQLLMDSIGGTSMTIMLACVSPASSHLNETVRTLNYASSAKNIKNKPVVLLDPQQQMVSELKKEIDQLRAENKALRDALLGQSQQGPSQSQIGGSRSTSAPGNQTLDALNQPSSNLRHSTGCMPQHDGAHNRSADSVLSFPSPSNVVRRTRRPDDSPPRQTDLRHSMRNGGGGRSPNNYMPRMQNRPSPDKSKHGHGVGGGEYGRVRPQDPLAHRRSEIQPAHFQMPQIQVSGRPAHEIHADERAMYRELESAATFSYFNQKTDADTSPTSYHHVIRTSGALAEEDREKALARQRMKTAERHLREEILLLPEAQEYHTHHHRRMLPPGERPRSKSVVAGEGGARGKKKRSPVSERAGLRELEKLSKFSYFNDDVVTTGTKSQGQGANSVPLHSVPGVYNSGGHSFPHDKAKGGPAQVSTNGLVDMPGDRSTLSYGKRVGESSSGTLSGHDRGSASGRVNGYGYRNYYDHSESGDIGGVESPKSIRDHLPRAGSPKSIRSSAADGMYKGSAARNGHRPTSAERERLLDEAFDDMLAGVQEPVGTVAPGAASRAGVGDDDWMTRLNPLAGVNLDSAAAGNWQQELDRAARRGGPDVGVGRAQSPNISAPRSERPRSANRPPSVPRNYPHAQQQMPSYAEPDARARAQQETAHGSTMSDALRDLGSGSQMSHMQGVSTQWGGMGVAGGGGGAAASRSTNNATASGGGSSYEELMRNLEQSRLKAQQARLSIMEKRAKFLPDRAAHE